jgi:hypothetical protein
MEPHLHELPKKAKFIAGQESNGWMERQFEKGHNFAIEETFEPAGFECQKLHQSNLNEVKSALNDNPLYFIYSGHGYFTYLAGGSFDLYGNDLDNRSNHVFPFGFSFACLTGNYGHNTSVAFAESWMRNQKGGVAYFVSSVNTYPNSDKAIEKKIFGETFDDSEYLKGMIDLGMKGYWKRFWSWLNRKRTKRHMKSYNLLGDPSLKFNEIEPVSYFYLAGNDLFLSGSKVVYQAENNIQNEAGFVIYSGAEVTLIAGGEIRLQPGFHAKSGSEFIDKIEPLNVPNKPQKIESNNDDILDLSDKSEKNVENIELFFNISQSYELLYYNIIYIRRKFIYII